MEKKIITITSLGSSGEGVGSFDGLKFFVEGALPNEQVIIQVTEKKKNYAKGKLLKIVSPSLHRVQPPCPYFQECGGCQIMHLSYENQLEAKQQKVVDALERIGHFSNLNISPCLPSPQKLHYRNKIQLPIIWDRHTKKIGLFKNHSHEVIPIDKCLIQSEKGESILSFISSNLQVRSVDYVLIRHSHFTDEAMVVFITNGKEKEPLQQFSKILMEKFPQIKGIVENINKRSGNRILGERFTTLAGQPYIFEILLDKKFKISPSSFFQVNSEQASNLFSKAIEFAQIEHTQTVIDAYCGVGTLAILAADQAKEVIGIEIVEEAIQNARENAILNEIDNATFICGQSEKILEKLPPCDILFLNPPRKGCDPRLIKTILSFLPKKIIYISCNPSTLARDLALLNQYRIVKIQPLDMFPQTMHVETIVSLSL